MVRQRVGLLVALRGPAPLHGVATLLSPFGTAGAAAPSAARPTTADRMRDAAALALVVGGAATFMYARLQLQRLAANQITRIAGQSAIEQARHFDRLSVVGLWVAGAGLVAAVAVALVRARRRPTSHPTAES